jgi:hypothetical protein
MLNYDVQKILTICWLYARGSITGKMVCSLVHVENHKDGCIHNMATSKMNYEIEFHVLEKKLNSLLN